VLSKDSTPRYGRRLLRCGISIRPLSAGSLASETIRARRQCMSALPQKRTNGQTVPLSPLSAKSGHTQRSKRELFDHLVSAREHRRRHVKAERLGGLEVDSRVYRLRQGQSRQAHRGVEWHRNSDCQGLYVRRRGIFETFRQCPQVADRFACAVRGKCQNQRACEGWQTSKNRCEIFASLSVCRSATVQTAQEALLYFATWEEL
jgi:hypothetical protein